MKTIIFVEPTPKGRPRMAVKGGRVQVYTPKKTEHAENLIRQQVVNLKCYFNSPIPLRLTATFYRQRPKSLPKKVTMPVQRPDWDQYSKLTCDALEKFLYDNDSQITSAHIKKRFGSPPRIELELEVDNE